MRTPWLLLWGQDCLSELLSLGKEQRESREGPSACCELGTQVEVKPLPTFTPKLSFSPLQVGMDMGSHGPRATPGLVGPFLAAHTESAGGPRLSSHQ